MTTIFEKEKKLSDVMLQLDLGKIQIFIDSCLLPFHNSDSKHYFWSSQSLSSDLCSRFRQ